jgi:hypothetical protein
MERSVSHATDQRETVLAAVAALERKLAREVQAVPTVAQVSGWGVYYCDFMLLPIAS